ncbi:MAG: hypothetical protein HC777_02665 [Hyphomonadaceae bacterium]|nr:hypothetical protein [Hyphomonadaceae bacterium]
MIKNLQASFQLVIEAIMGRGEAALLPADHRQVRPLTVVVSINGVLWVA